MQWVNSYGDAKETYRSTDGGDTWAAWQPPIAFTSDRDGNREIYTTDRPESHPAWLYDAGCTLLVAADQERASAINRASYGAATSEYRPLTSTSAFNGHPAGEPVCWVPDESASLAWLREHESITR